MEAQIVRLDHHKACRRSVEGRESVVTTVKCVLVPVESHRVDFDHRKLCRSSLGACRVRFDNQKVCRKPVEAR